MTLYSATLDSKPATCTCDFATALPITATNQNSPAASGASIAAIQKAWKSSWHCQRTYNQDEAKHSEFAEPDCCSASSFPKTESSTQHFITTTDNAKPIHWWCRS